MDICFTYVHVSVATFAASPSTCMEAAFGRLHKDGAGPPPAARPIFVNYIVVDGRPIEDFQRSKEAKQGSKARKQSKEANQISKAKKQRTEAKKQSKEAKQITAKQLFVLTFVCFLDHGGSECVQMDFP